MSLVEIRLEFSECHISLYWEHIMMSFTCLVLYFVVLVYAMLYILDC